MPLFLLPNVLGDVEDASQFLPKSVGDVVVTLQGIIAESEKEARRFLRRYITREQLDHVKIALLNEHTKPEEREALFRPLLKGERWGLISDCGLPCLADPGSLIVARAYELKIQVEAFVGPSSIILALMLSGLSGQRFAFHGYIAKEEPSRKHELKLWERRAKEEKETQIFMEAPYRNMHAFQAALETLDDSTKLCVAWNLTLPDQGLIVAPIRQWKKKEAPPIIKQPALFLFNA